MMKITNKKDVPRESLSKMADYGVKQREMAKTMKVSQSTISRKMRGGKDNCT